MRIKEFLSLIIFKRLFLYMKCAKITLHLSFLKKSNFLVRSKNWLS